MEQAIICGPKINLMRKHSIKIFLFRQENLFCEKSKIQIFTFLAFSFFLRNSQNFRFFKNPKNQRKKF